MKMAFVKKYMDNYKKKNKNKTLWLSLSTFDSWKEKLTVPETDGNGKHMS